MAFVKMKILRGFTEIKHVYSLIKDTGATICGGYARYCASTHKEPSPSIDLDIYCTDDAVMDIVRKRFEAALFTIHIENEMSIIYNKRKDVPEYVACPKINLIKPRLEFRVVTKGSAEEIISNFDFSVVRCAIINEDEVLADEDFEKDESRKFIRIKNIHCPISSAIRFCKYYKKGYWTKPIQILKLFVDWNNRDESYRIRLIDYLEKYNLFQTKDPNEDNVVETTDGTTEKKNQDGLSDEDRAELYKIMLID